MKLTGCHIIAADSLAAAEQSFYAINPITDERLPPAFCEGTAAQVESAVSLAARDFAAYRHLPLSERADFLLAIADQLLALKDDLLLRAHQESGLPAARLEGELGRTVNQLRLFADFVRDGKFLHTQIDQALPDRQPLPRADIRMTQMPLGPVAVFGASNFPLAFSVAGGDTASALAAGCPVIVKGHPAHPGTSELAGLAIRNAIEQCGLPPGVFALLQGSTAALGAALVQHPALAAVAFTGSLRVGRALFDLAAARAQPIPLFAEMGSVNPIFVLPQALANYGEQLAKEFSASVSLGVGQFCTNPGLLFALKGSDLDAFVRSVQQVQSQTEPAAMLHAGIKDNYLAGVGRLSLLPEVELFAGRSVAAGAGCFVSPALFLTSAATFIDDPRIGEEVFGPSAVIIACDSFVQMKQAAEALAGQLTASLHATVSEEEQCRELFAILETKAGRLILNSFPTGVEVCHAMVHGGPYPATTDSRSTSVGTEALRRFLRPICYQGFSASLLPVEVTP